MSKQFEVLSAVHGIAPRSDELLRLGGDVDRGRASALEYDELLQHESEEWLNVQQVEGIDRVSAGKLDWQDHLRPIVQATDGFKPGIDNAQVTRWYETNTFYRRPTITSYLNVDSSKLPGEYGSSIDLLAPYSFASLCDNASTGKTLELVTDLYDQIIYHYVNKGVGRIVLKEYTHQRLEDRILSNESLKEVTILANRYQSTEFAYLTSETSVPKDAPLNLGLEITPHTAKALSLVPYLNNGLEGRNVWTSVVHADSTLPDVSMASFWNKYILRQLGIAKLILTNTVDFQHIPLDYAKEKIKWLAEETRQTKSQLGDLS